MMFQVGGTSSVLADEVVRWLTDKQVGTCVGVISNQALQHSWWVGVLLSFLLCSHMALSRSSKKPLKSHISSAFPEDMGFAEKPHGAFHSLRAQDSSARWDVGVAASHLLSEADGVA